MLFTSGGPGETHTVPKTLKFSAVAYKSFRRVRRKFIKNCVKAAMAEDFSSSE